MPVYDLRLDYPEENNSEQALADWADEIAHWLHETHVTTALHYGVERLNKFRDIIKYHAHFRFVSETSESTLRKGIKEYFHGEAGRDLGRSEYKLGNVDKRKGVVTDIDFWRYPWKECRLGQWELGFWQHEPTAKIQEHAARDQRDRDQKLNIEKRERENNHKTTTVKIRDYIEVKALPKSSKEDIAAACIAWCDSENHAIDYNQIRNCARLICMQLKIIPRQYFVDKILESF